MSDDKFGGQEKTEEPTPRQEERFREEGQVAQSQEITSLAGMAVCLLGFYMVGDKMLIAIQESFRATFRAVSSTEPIGSLENIIKIGGNIFAVFAPIPIIIFIAVVVAGIAQTGLLFSWKALEPKLERLSPKSGFGRVFSMQMLFTFGKNVLKASVMGYIFYVILEGRIPEIIGTSTLSLHEALSYNLDLVSRAIFASIGFILFVAVGDYFYNYRSMHKKMMMSREELREEMKQTQLPDNVRAKVRQAQQDKARRSIDKEVPTADVVITNPTHVAVAIRYVRGSYNAPRVVAKGVELLAKRIREVATKNGVPLYEEPPLARTLYRRVKVGKEVPGDLFKAVAKILAYIYSLRRKNSQFTDIRTGL